MRFNILTCGGSWPIRASSGSGVPRQPDSGPRRYRSAGALTALGSIARSADVPLGVPEVGCSDATVAK